MRALGTPYTRIGSNRDSGQLSKNRDTSPKFGTVGNHIMNCSTQQHYMWSPYLQLTLKAPSVGGRRVDRVKRSCTWTEEVIKTKVN